MFQERRTAAVAGSVRSQARLTLPVTFVSMWTPVGATLRRAGRSPRNGRTSSCEVYRGYNLRTPGSVSSAACIASKSVAGNEATARPKKRSLEA